MKIGRKQERRKEKDWKRKREEEEEKREREHPEKGRWMEEEKLDRKILLKG